MTYGEMIDFIWAVNGQPGKIGENIARRMSWPLSRVIKVRPFTAEQIKAQGAMAMSHGVFLPDGTEYTSPAEDMAATDWEG